MHQQILALLIVGLFIGRLLWQKKNNQIANTEFIFWLFFWLVSGVAIIFLKNLDRLVAVFGFSGSGIEVLLYMAVVILFYLIFKLRLRLERLEQNLTKIVTEIAINNKNKL